MQTFSRYCCWMIFSSFSPHKISWKSHALHLMIMPGSLWGWNTKSAFIRKRMKALYTAFHNHLLRHSNKCVPCNGGNPATPTLFRPQLGSEFQRAFTVSGLTPSPARWEVQRRLLSPSMFFLLTSFSIKARFISIVKNFLKVFYSFQ